MRILILVSLCMTSYFIYKYISGGQTGAMAMAAISFCLAVFMLLPWRNTLPREGNKAVDPNSSNEHGEASVDDKAEQVTDFVESVFRDVAVCGNLADGAGAVPPPPDQAIEATVALADAASGVADAVSGAADAASGVADAVSGTIDAASGVAEAASGAADAADAVTTGLDILDFLG